MSLLSRKPTPMVVDCRRSPIEEQTLAARVNVPISDATVEIRIGTNGAYASPQETFSVSQIRAAFKYEVWNRIHARRLARSHDEAVGALIGHGDSGPFRRRGGTQGGPAKSGPGAETATDGCRHASTAVLAHKLR
jgi:hypothetical protein